MQIPIKTLNLCGGCSGNRAFYNVFKEVADDYNLDLMAPYHRYTTDNPVSIAWVGWEYLNAKNTIDISDRSIHPINNIPLGNYIDYIASSFKGVGRVKKFGSRWQREQSYRS